MKVLRNIVKRIPFLAERSRQRKILRWRSRYEQWKQEGAVLPLPTYGKQLVLQEYALRFGPRILIETGTYTGHTVMGLLDKFDRVYSIELDPTLCKKAQQLFAQYPHVQIIEGASEVCLPHILSEVDQPCLFWLDAHYSKGATAKGETETPIIRELDSILQHSRSREHVLLIDDARCFTGQNDYPTVAAVREAILKEHPDWQFDEKDDILRAHRVLERA
ncbi:MAG: hypothetical protein JXA82_11385 [Sedimentisphaerales bacterium]|nr:hypothetical protein [Sedimentisphaerales bacterium]